LRRVTITTVCVFVPIFLFKNRLGILGQLFQDMIFTVGISLVASLFVALFLVPVLAGKYFPLSVRSQKPLKNRFLKKADAWIECRIAGITGVYKKILAAALRRRVFTLCAVLAVFVLSVFTLPRLAIRFLPDVNEYTVTLGVEHPLGTPYAETRYVMSRFQEFAAAQITGLRSLIANVGTTGRSYMSRNSENAGELIIKLNLNNPDADTGETAKEKLRAHFRDFPNANFSFDGGMDSILSGGADIDIVLDIDDIGAGLAAAEEIRELIKDIPGLEEILIDTKGGLPQVEIFLDRGRVYDMGLSVENVADEIAAALNGLTAAVFRHAGNEYDLRLMLDEGDRKKIPDLRLIPAASESGALVPLANFASLEKGLGPVTINRENQSRVIHITAALTGRASAAEMENTIRDLLRSNFIAPEDVGVHFDGSWGETRKMLLTFISIISLALLLVFGAMAGQYESFKDPLVNICTVPFLLIGVVAIHFVTGHALNAFSMAGIVMLAGIVVNNGIILVDYTNILVRSGLPVREACLEAGASRLRPVLMTALTTILGLIPMSFFPGESAVMTQSLGLTVVGGLTSSTLLTLFFVPLMYSLINRKQGNRRKA
jgi:HAE1 family hydrophobic/amphiphilic exporter-1